MASYGVGRALLLRGPTIGSTLNTSSVLNHVARNNTFLVVPKNGETASYSTTVLQTPKLGKQTKPISENVERNLSAIPGVAFDHDSDEDLRIDMRTEVPGK